MTCTVPIPHLASAFTANWRRRLRLTLPREDATRGFQAAGKCANLRANWIQPMFWMVGTSTAYDMHMIQYLIQYCNLHTPIEPRQIQWNTTFHAEGNSKKKKTTSARLCLSETFFAYIYIYIFIDTKELVGNDITSSAVPPILRAPHARLKLLTGHLASSFRETHGHFRK